jgi:hypothetical protein
LSGHRRPAAVVAAALLAFLSAGTAFAATPQQIYKDVIDNAKLDGRYSSAELERAFDLPTDVGTDQKPRKPIRVLVASEAAEAPAAPARAADRRIPFSAIDAALVAAGALPLLLVGVGLRRRVSAPRKAQALSG